MMIILAIFDLTHLASVNLFVFVFFDHTLVKFHKNEKGLYIFLQSMLHLLQQLFDQIISYFEEANKPQRMLQSLFDF